MTAEHPNIDLMLLTTPASYFCVTISKVILYTEKVVVVQVQFHNFQEGHSLSYSQRRPWSLPALITAIEPVSAPTKLLSQR